MTTPNGWKQGIQRIPLHSAFSLVGVGARFLPPPWNFVAIGGFAAWRAVEEVRDVTGKRDTHGKAVIDWVSQVGSAAAGAFIPWHF